jgi:carboxymethylenebutenolidase
VALLVLLPAGLRGEEGGTLPERVTFTSADGRTMLVGYLYKPSAPAAERIPAVVMMHGRAGAYSERANGVYDASTLSLRHKAWGRTWAEAGYIALLVDGYGPRGYWQGFPRHSYDSRPAELNEVTVRPLDAYGALAYLRSRADVLPDRIGLQGWSNGGSATIATMAPEAPGITSPTAATGFRAALAFYPACGLKGQFDGRPFLPYAPVLVLHGTADEEVSYRRCAALVERSRANGGNVQIKVYQGATHSFDSPSRKRQKVDANAEATQDALARARRFFAEHLGGGS